MNLNRRSFLLAGLGTLATPLLGTVPGRVTALGGAGRGTGKIVVFVNLLGGIDGLTAVVNYGQSAYYSRRPSITVPPPGQPGGALDLEPTLSIGMTPLWPQLHALYQAGDLAIVQKVGYPTPNLSHFESQDIWSRWRRDVAHPDPRGGLGRLSDTYFTQQIDLVGINTGSRLDFLSNLNKKVVLAGLDSFVVPVDAAQTVDSGFRNQSVAQVNASSTNTDPLLIQVKSTTESALGLVAQVQTGIASYPNSVVYPNSSLGRSLRDAARLIHANLGTQVFYVATGGFDSHANQTTLLTNLGPDISSSVGAFVADVQGMSRWNDVAVVIFSEFGRRNFQNGSTGTDHGHGNYVWIAGGAVNGGLKGAPVTNADLNLDYLPGTIDFRQIYWDITAQHLAYDPAPILSDFVPTPGGLSIF